MNILKSIKSKTWLFYAVALFCFMLPFGNISCSAAPEATIAKASGIQIILDKVTITDSELSKESSEKDSDKPNFHIGIRAMTAVTLLALVFGIVCLLRNPAAYTIASGAGVGVAICLVVGLLVMRDAAKDYGFIISPAYGWWFTLLLSLAGSALAFWFGKQTKTGENIGDDCEE